MATFTTYIRGTTLTRMDMLRIVMGVSRAEVNRQALEHGGLDALEKPRAERLERLRAVAPAGAAFDAWLDEIVRNAGQAIVTLEELEALRAGSASGQRSTGGADA